MTPFTLELQPSQWLRYWLTGIHLLAATLVALTPIPPLPKLVLLTIIGTGYAIQFKQLFRAPLQPPLSLHVRDSTPWLLTTAAGQALEIELRHSIVFRHLIVLYLHTEAHGNRTLIIPSDSLPAEGHRRLRRLLRLKSTS